MLKLAFFFQKKLLKLLADFIYFLRKVFEHFYLLKLNY